MHLLEGNGEGRDSVREVDCALLVVGHGTDSESHQMDRSWIVANVVLIILLIYWYLLNKRTCPQQTGVILRMSRNSDLIIWQGWNCKVRSGPRDSTHDSVHFPQYALIKHRPSVNRLCNEAARAGFPLILLRVRSGTGRQNRQIRTVLIQPVFSHSLIFS